MPSFLSSSSSPSRPITHSTHVLPKKYLRCSFLLAFFLFLFLCFYSFKETLLFSNLSSIPLKNSFHPISSSNMIQNPTLAIKDPALLSQFRFVAGCIVTNPSGTHVLLVTSRSAEKKTKKGEKKHSKKNKEERKNEKEKDSTYSIQIQNTNENENTNENQETESETTTSSQPLELWILPKGGFHSEKSSSFLPQFHEKQPPSSSSSSFDASLEEAAARETQEEAGIGLTPSQLRYVLMNKHPKQKAHKKEEIFYWYWVNHIAQEFPDTHWLESHERQRKWFPIKIAIELLAWKSHMQEALIQADTKFIQNQSDKTTEWNTIIPIE